MLTLFKKFAVAGLSTTVLAGSLVPAQAMPLPAVEKPAAASEDAGAVSRRLLQRPSRLP